MPSFPRFLCICLENSSSRTSFFVQWLAFSVVFPLNGFHLHVVTEKALAFWYQDIVNNKANSKKI